MSVGAFWNYIHERETIRLARISGKPWPWTNDLILQRYKFTNVKRLHDKTTQAFLSVYQKHTDASQEVALYNCAVRRFFGTIEFSNTVGWLDGHSPEILLKAKELCPKPWTGAYIIRAGSAGSKKVDSVIEYLRGLWEEPISAITSAIDATKTWQSGYLVMRRCFGFGPFMSKEVLQDYILWLHACGVSLVDEETFTPVGPGGRRGLNRLCGRELEASISESEMLTEIQMLVKGLQPLWLSAFNFDRLTAHDIQFCLCEFDKYERARLGEGRPKAIYKHHLEKL